jgi:hypothetical protein
MDDRHGDRNRALMLDGNAVAGLLYDVFGVEMTASPTACAHCGQVSAMGALLAFTQAPGVVLRCPACEQVIVRLVETAEVIYLDARGATYLRLERRSA